MLKFGRAGFFLRALIYRFHLSCNNAVAQRCPVMPMTLEINADPGTSSREVLIFNETEPECLTIIPTYRCNASCTECCFESNPSIRHRMTRADLLSIIQKVATEFPRVRYVVLTGGEVTLLKDDLIDAIRLLSSLGLGSRIVTNGHWGRTDESAIRWVMNLRAAGLSELNLSTGDEHQEWVPFASVARAAYHALTSNLTTVIVVEGQDNAKFTLDSVKDNEHIQKIHANGELRKKFVLMSNIWMPFHEGANCTSDPAEVTHEGCDNIFENFVVNPYGHLMSCCGLTMEHIPELKVGNIYRDSLSLAYRTQYSDVLKLWIWLDGTRHIFDRLAECHDLKLLSPHPCAICAQLYKTDHIRETLITLLQNNEESIVFRAAIKAKISGRAAKTEKALSESG
jgi:organic radical activating enzyme